MSGDDDQIVPIKGSALSAKPVKTGKLKVYEGFPQGMATTHGDAINGPRRLRQELTIAFPRALEQFQAKRALGLDPRVDAGRLSENKS